MTNDLIYKDNDIIKYHLVVKPIKRSQKEIDNILSMLNELSSLDREVLSN